MQRSILILVKLLPFVERCDAMLQQSGQLCRRASGFAIRESIKHVLLDGDWTGICLGAGCCEEH